MNECWVAVHKQTGHFFVGKTTQTGYTTKRNLALAISYRKGRGAVMNYHLIKIEANELLTDGES